MDDIKLTLLSDEQIFRQIDVMKRLGGKCAISDFAILLGGYVNDNYHVAGDSSLKGRTGAWYSTSAAGSGKVRFVGSDGDTYDTKADWRCWSVRPVLPFFDISDISPNGVRRRRGFLEVKYGEYPQYAVDSRLGRTLESEYSAGRLKKTGKTYTTDSRRWDKYSEGFSPVEHEEFEYKGKKYVRVKSNCYESWYKLSNGVNVMPNDIVWLEVSPITWYVDKSSRMLVSKISLVSGIRFFNGKYWGDFEKTEMQEYLNKYMVRDMFQSVKLKEENKDTKGQTKLSEKSGKVNDIINEIKKLIEFVPDKETVLKQADDLVNNYNKSINNIFNNENKLTLEQTNKETLYLKLISDLKEILEQVKIKSDKYKEYYSMLKITGNCLKILDSKDKNMSDFSGDIEKFVIEIKKVVELFVDDDKVFLDDETKLYNLKNIFFEAEKLIKDYLKGDNDFGKKCKTVDDFKLYIRKKLHPYLADLDLSVKNANTAKKIMDESVKLMNGTYESEKNDYVSGLLSAIKELIDLIKRDGNEEENSKLAEIMKEEIHDKNNLDEVVRQTRKTYINIYKIVLNMNERLAKEAEFDNYIVTVNGKSNKF